MDLSWIETSLSASLMVVFSSIIIYVVLITLVRLSGVRSFSKLSGFDFAITVAIGSLLASTVLTKNPPLLQAIVALVTLFAIQMIVASLRNYHKFTFLVDNKPVLLMKGSKLLIDNMKKAKVTRSDLLAKIRGENILKVEHIFAVVMETTGDISVLHKNDRSVDFDTVLMDDLEEKFKGIETSDESNMNLVDIKSTKGVSNFT